MAIFVTLILFFLLKDGDIMGTIILNENLNATIDFLNNAIALCSALSI